MRHERARFHHPLANILMVCGLLLAPGVVFGQYQSFMEDYEGYSVEPSPEPEPTPTPRRGGALTLSVRVPPGPFEPGASIVLEAAVGATGAVPRHVSVAAMALDDRAGIVAPSRGTLPGTGTWRTRFRAGEIPGSWQILVVAQDRDGDLAAASSIVTVTIGAKDPVVVAGGRVLHPMPDTTELRSRNRSWKSELMFRRMFTRDPVGELAEKLESRPDYRELISDAVALDKRQIAMTGKWPDKERFRSHARLESIMSRYWADAGITISAATANEVGNVFLAWHRTGGAAVTLSEDVARSLGTGAKVIKVGNVLNGVGAAMIVLDFWNNMTSAETPVEAREAWYKAGYASLDLYLANAVGDLFGPAAALPGMFTSYILTNAYDTLIGGYKSCWFKKMVEQAVAENWLGDGPGDVQAVQQVMAAMQSPQGLKGTLMAWWENEAPTWAAWMGGCGNWDLAEARGYREAFVDRLMRTAEVEVNGRRYHPWAFYYGVSMQLVREARHRKALEIARQLLDLEAAYIETLYETRVDGAFTVRLGSADGPPLPGAAVAPAEWRFSEGWMTGPDGTVSVHLRETDLSPWGTLLLMVRPPNGPVRYYVVPPSAFRAVTP